MSYPVLMPCSSGNEHPQLPSRHSQLPRPWNHSTNVSDLQHSKPVPTGLLKHPLILGPASGLAGRRGDEASVGWADPAPVRVALIRRCCGLSLEHGPPRKHSHLLPKHRGPLDRPHELSGFWEPTPASPPVALTLGRTVFCDSPVHCELLSTNPPAVMTQMPADNA